MDYTREHGINESIFSEVVEKPIETETHKTWLFGEGCGKVPCPECGSLSSTQHTFNDTDAGRNLIVCEDIDDMFGKLGL